MDKAKTILKNIFGYDSFRPLQKEIIGNVLLKNDTLVVMPTGGGKSICYQIPALLFEGLTVVISPLISLMKDQITQLRQIGINAALLNSSLSSEEYKYNLESVKNKTAKLLYIAPESLAKEEILNLLLSVSVDCITVDEAHCISEWGHDFRKDYRQLGSLRKKFSSAVCIGLTATATPRVQNDIVQNLEMKSHKRFLGSFDRENLFLQIIPKQNPFEQTVSFLNEHKNQPGIIYCFSRKQVDALHEKLSALGFSTRPYHAGLSDDERNLNQDLFTRDEIEIIIATIAFGMGINKSNVRFVVHYDLPKNIESYYQEIGRSGRDGLRSDCLLLFSYSDIAKINYFIDQKENDSERLSAKLHLEAMVKYSESEICRRVPLINYFGEKYDNSNCGMCDNCLGDEKEKTDITIYAQKFLSAVKRTGEIFGAGYVIDILLGNDNDRILSNAHHKLSVFGIGTELNKKQWQLLVRQLINKELLSRDIEFGSLKHTPKTTNVLFKNEKVFGFIKVHKTSPAKLKRADKSYDTALFELLRRKRKELAEERGIPPYIIFSDKTLAEMAYHYPADEESFLRINGIGNKKAESYGNIFLPVIKKYCAKNNIKEVRAQIKTNTTKNHQPEKRHTVIGKSFKAGASIDRLAEEYQVTKQTIVRHLAKFVDEGNKIKTESLLNDLSIPRDKQQMVIEEFSKESISSLKPVYYKFNQEVSYDDLYILRIIFKSGNL